MELILTHLNADFDALASAVAAGKLYPRAKIFLPGSQERNVREFIRQYPQLFVKVVKARALHGKIFSKIVLVDVSDLKRLGQFRTLLAQGKPEIVCYDHHTGHGRLSGDGVCITEKVGANVTLMIRQLEAASVDLSPLEATLMALGLYEETGNFTYTSTQPEDFRAAAYLRAKGADLTVVSEHIRRHFTGEQQRLFEDLIKSRNTLRVNGREISLVTAERENFIEDLAVIVNRIKELENLAVLIAVCRMHERCYMIARSSLASVDVGRLLRHFSGGGHATAASAVVKTTALGTLRRKILSVLQKEIRPVMLVRHAMSNPVISVPLRTPVRQARARMLRFGHSGLPVLDHHRLAGIVTLHDLDKAFHHGYEDAEVGTYMTSQPVTVGPETPLTEAARLMLEKRIRYLPVVRRGSLAGMLTKSDILSHSQESETHDVVRARFPLWAESELDQSRVRQMMQEQLPERVVALLHTAGEVAQTMGIQAYVVGGFVRDLILRVENLDVDIMVEGDGLAYARALGKKLGGQVKLHDRFQTAKIKCRDDFTIDVASARTETYPTPGALPHVESASLKYDLFRRDFSINAMAVRMNPETFGELVDAYGGVHDLHVGSVRVLYALSFIDDPTRIFRAIRFSQRFGFEIERDTRRYLQHALKMDLMAKLSRPRIFDELMLILEEDQPLKALQQLDRLKLGAWIHPGLRSMKTVLRRMRTVWETFAFAILFLDNVPLNRQAVYLMTLLQPLNAAQARDMAIHSQFPKKVTELVLQQKEAGDQAVAALRHCENADPIIAVRRFRGLHLEVLLHLMNQNRGNAVDKLIRKYLMHWRHVKPQTAGRDLKRMGYPPGPAYDRMLDKLLALRLQDKLANRQEEIAYLRKNYPLPT